MLSSLFDLSGLFSSGEGAYESANADLEGECEEGVVTTDRGVTGRLTIICALHEVRCDEFHGEYVTHKRKITRKCQLRRMTPKIKK